MQLGVAGLCESTFMAYHKLLVTHEPECKLSLTIHGGYRLLNDDWLRSDFLRMLERQTKTLVTHRTYAMCMHAISSLV